MSARSFVILLAASVTLVGCDTNNLVNNSPLLDPPANLAYALDPSGDPDLPAGILLRWDDINSSMKFETPFHC